MGSSSGRSGGEGGGLGAPMDRRAFVGAGLALSAAGGALPGLAHAAADPMFAAPYVDVDEWRDAPVRHRYVHGGFRDTPARFVMRFPEAARYGGRFFQYVTPVPLPEEQAAGPFGGADDFMGFCFDSGAFAVASNQGGLAAAATPGSPVDPTIAAYRVSAATARFARELAGRMYGPHRTYGYAFGGSGGAFRTLSGAENTDAWDGVVPFIHGSAGSIPNNYAARLRGLRDLKAKLPQIADALEPGGGDVYAALNGEERAVLTEITRLGFPLRTWVFHEAMGLGAFSILFQSIQNADPAYFEDFWTRPGHLGFDPPPALRAARLQHAAVVKRVILSSEAAAAGVPAPGRPGARFSASPEEAWRNLADSHGGDPLPVAFELDRPAPDGDWTAAGVFVTSGQSAGKRLDLQSVKGDIVALQFGPASGSLREVTGAIRPGDRLRLDNSNFLAFPTYYRHALLPADYPVSDHLRGPDGRPLYPQRPKLIAHSFVRSAMGAPMTGRFHGKMIVVNCLLDWDAAPWHAHWYRSLVRRNLGPAFEDRYRLWYVDHATHGQIPDPTRTIPYQGVLQQALRDLSAWAERGVAPPAETSYRFEGGQVTVPATAAARKGVQPVVALTAGGAQRAEVKVGEPVRFAAQVETPPGAGAVVSAEWDFEAGPAVVAGEAGRFPVREQFTPAPSLTLTRTHVFTRPGTYFPALRVHAHRTGDASARYARVPNLGRVRVVVS